MGKRSEKIKKYVSENTMLFFAQILMVFLLLQIISAALWMPGTIVLAIIPAMTFAIISIVFALLISDFQSVSAKKNFTQNNEILQEIKNLNITMTNIQEILKGMKKNENKAESEKKNDESGEENLKE